MGADSDHFTYPEGPFQAGFTDADKKRIDRNVEKLRERLAANCKHIIKGEPRKSKKWIRRAEIEKERERLEEKLAAAELEANGYID